MTNELVKPITCPRCEGKGNIGGVRVHAGVPGGCFTCDGLGVVEGDRATIAAAKAYVAQRTALGQAAFGAGQEAHTGLSMLEANEPARCAKAVAAFAAGDPRVIPALVDYFRAAA